MLAIYSKEMRSYFISAVGYVYTGIFLTVAALLCCYTTLLSNSYSTSSFFTLLIVAFIVLLPLLTMKLFSEEKKLRTEQLLLTAPVSITSMVMGKFLAAMTMFGGSTLLACINFLPIYIIAGEEQAAAAQESGYALSPHIGPATAQILGCLIGILLIGAAFLAIGLFVSSLCENQLSAAVITIAILLVMVVLNFINSAELIDNYVLRFIIDWVCVLSRFTNFSNGIFDIPALIYYLSLASVFLFLTVRVYEKRRWA